MEDSSYVVTCVAPVAWTSLAVLCVLSSNGSSLKLCLGLMLLHMMEFFVTKFTCLILQKVLMELPRLLECNEPAVKLL